MKNAATQALEALGLPVEDCIQLDIAFRVGGVTWVTAKYSLQSGETLSKVLKDIPFQPARKGEGP